MPLKKKSVPANKSDNILARFYRKAFALVKFDLIVARLHCRTRTDGSQLIEKRKNVEIEPDLFVLLRIIGHFCDASDYNQLQVIELIIRSANAAHPVRFFFQKGGIDRIRRGEFERWNSASQDIPYRKMQEIEKRK